MSLPSHGKLICRNCFISCNSKDVHPHPLWKLKNDPGAWGGSTPQVLVLGFSKGSTQVDIYESGTFEDVAFGGNIRNRLDQLLKSIGLLNEVEHVTREIENTESRIAFGSLVRCSLTRRGKDGKHASSGDLIVKSFGEIPEILKNCTNEFLGNLPKQTKIVLMLGVTQKYVAGCYDLLKGLYPELMKINSVSYGDRDRVFVHVTHPSPSNGHFKSWRRGNSKYDDALAALALSVSMPISILSKSAEIFPLNINIAHKAERPNYENELSVISPIKTITIDSDNKNASFKTRKKRIPVSTVSTGCIPFNISQHGKNGYKVGEVPVKNTGFYVTTFDGALEALRRMNNSGWRAYGNGLGSNQGARKSIGWVTIEDADRLLSEFNDAKRVALFKSLTNVIQ